MLPTNESEEQGVSPDMGTPSAVTLDHPTVFFEMERALTSRFEVPWLKDKTSTWHRASVRERTFVEVRAVVLFDTTPYAAQSRIRGGRRVGGGNGFGATF